MKLSDNFDSNEFRCPCKACTGIESIVAPELIENLEKLRALLNADIKPGEKEHGLTVTSGCRCPDHNKKEGGATSSRHLYDPTTGKAGQAADIFCTTRPTREVYQAALTIPGFKGIGLAPPQMAIPPDPSTHKPGRPALPGYVHVDVRPDLLRSQWGYDDSGAVVALATVLPRDWTV
jgi:Peptidase M15.